MRTLGVAFTLMMSLVASRVAAQTAVLFAVGGDAQLAADHGTEVIGRVQRELEDSSFTVLSGEALASAMSAAHADECPDPSCAGPMLTALSADLGVGVALWRRNGVVQVSVVLVDPHGVQVSADADGAESVLGQATESALAQARARWATRGGSPVRAVGTPEGATITVDREPWGTLPHEGTLSPGTHHFVVSADGHVTERRDVEIAAGTETIELTFALPAGSAEPPSDGGGPEMGLIAGGAIAAAVGAGVLSIGIANAVDTERCVSGCGPTDTMRTVHVPATDIGVGLAIGGAVVLVVGAVLIGVGAASGSSRSPVAMTSHGLTFSF